MQVRLINTTPDAEATIAYCARVSSNNQKNPDYVRLFNYMIEHKHWSPFEMADMTVEIITTRSIAPQILRHKSFAFQEFSQRYSEVQEFGLVELRLQGLTKQGSGEIYQPTDKQAWAIRNLRKDSMNLYKDLIKSNVSRETAREYLLLCTQTKLYMKGCIRSWIHYLEIRCAEDTQKEHRLIANEIKKIFIEQFPITSKSLGWIK